MRIVLLRRRLFTMAACAAVACAMFYLVNHPAIVGAAAGGRALPIYSVQRDHKVLSLTFDAAWGDVRVRMLERKGLRKQCLLPMNQLCNISGGATAVFSLCDSTISSADPYSF